MLKGRRIVLGVTGSVSAVESFRVARELKRRGAEVVSILTDSSLRFLTVDLMRFACDEVLTDFSEAHHVRLFGDSDLMLIAPATANTISKIASGIADTNVTLTALTAFGSGKPVLIAPAMHISMYRVVKENIDLLRSKGFDVIEPRFEEEKAKLADLESIILHVERALSGDEFEGKKVVVTSGPTFEFIDPIRFLSNKSSGRMGNELALELWRRKANVVLISSKPIDLNLPGFRVVRVTSVLDMLNAVLNEVKDCDLFVCASAPSDFTIERLNSKIKTTEELVLRFRQAPKIVKEVRRVYDGHIIGFKAETGVDDDELFRVARDKMVEDNLEMVVANDVRERGMGTEDTRVLVLTPNRFRWIEGLKDYVAREIVDIYVEEYL